MSLWVLPDSFTEFSKNLKIIILVKIFIFRNTVKRCNGYRKKQSSLLLVCKAFWFALLRLLPLLKTKIHLNKSELLSMWIQLNVQVWIFGGHLVGPFLFPIFNRKVYLQLSKETVDPIFQQDYAPQHYARTVRQYLDVTSPGRWIGRRIAIEWPLRSSDLSSFLFSDSLKI